MKTMNLPFIGRQFERKRLAGLLQKASASLVVVKGRRRVGKSRLIEEFGKAQARFHNFIGLMPDQKTTAQDQRDEFARQLGEQFNLPGLSSNDWGHLFNLLDTQIDRTGEGHTVVLLDEISWMGSEDSNFLGKLKIAWDDKFSKHPNLILVLCGSVSSWIDRNILSSTGFFGRVSLELSLEELFLAESNAMFENLSFCGSAYEKFKILCVTGGIPWYLEHVRGDLAADENIKQLCFVRDAILLKDFEKIFHDLFDRRGEWYRKIVRYLAEGASEYDKICGKTGYKSSGRISEYLDDLIAAGFVRRDFVWNLSTGKHGKLNHYRLRDNYLRFYLKYIAPQYDKIQKNQFAAASLSTYPGWSSILGLQFENLVLNNQAQVIGALGLKVEDIENCGPYFQRKTSKQAGCQIDFLIQMRYNMLFACEVKFSRHEIGSGIVQEMRDKLARLVLPKGFSCFPVLIHVNGVSDHVVDSGYFAKIIDFGSLLGGDVRNLR